MNVKVLKIKAIRNLLVHYQNKSRIIRSFLQDYCHHLSFVYVGLQVRKRTMEKGHTSISREIENNISMIQR